MPFRRVPGRVGPFRKWANKEIEGSELSDSATPSKTSSRRKRVRQSRFRRRRRKKEDL